MVITAFPECLQTGDCKVFNLVKRDVRTDRDSLIFIDNLNRIAFLQVHRTAHIMRECDSSEVVQPAYYVFVHINSFPEDKEPGTNTEFLASHMFLLLVILGIFFDYFPCIADQSRCMSKFPCRDVLIRLTEQLKEIQITQIGKHLGGRLK